MRELEPRDIARELSPAARSLIATFPDDRVSSGDLGVRGTMLASLCLWVPRKGKGSPPPVALLLRQYDEGRALFLYSLSDLGGKVQEVIRSASRET